MSGLLRSAYSAKIGGGDLSSSAADDPGRTTLRHLGDLSQVARSGPLFDGLVLDGESLTIEQLELVRPGNPNPGEPLCARRFHDGVSNWLGRHTVDKGRDHLLGSYRIEEVVSLAAVEID